MTQQTLAYPPKSSKSSKSSTPAGPDTAAATLMAPPASASASASAPAPSTQDTLFAGDTTPPAQPSDDNTLGGTLFADGTAAPAERKVVPAANTRGFATVLPDVRSDGDRLIIVPREQIRYEDAKLLGRGGMGEVKLAHDHDIGRKVAVKRLLDEDNPHAIARFVDEVRMVGNLEHPNIVTVHDVGVDANGAYFFVMKFVDGETLESIIEKLAAGDPAYHRRYGFEARLDLFVGLMRALQYAHSQGLVHRDVKPANIMVGEFGEVVLMDWGIAHRMRGDERATAPVGGPASMPALVEGPGTQRSSAETVEGSVVGTPQYMSPEQAAGEVAGLDGRSDLYSACVVLYELLTLTPYVEQGRTAMQTVVAASQRQPPSVIDRAYDNPYQPSVPVELRHFLRSALAHDKGARFDSAEELLWALERLRAGDCGVHCPVTFMKQSNAKMERFMDRYPAASMFLAAGTLLTFLGGLAGWVMWAMA